MRLFGISNVQLTLVVALLAGCTEAEKPSSDNEAMAEKIERLVELPEGAGPIDSYGRNYATGDDGKVYAVYTAPHGPEDTQAGASRWYENVDELPMIMDGGCSVVTVTYNPETEYVSASCNGVA